MAWCSGQSPDTMGTPQPPHPAPLPPLPRNQDGPPAPQRASCQDCGAGAGGPPSRCPKTHRWGRLSLRGRRSLLCLLAEGGITGFGSGRGGESRGCPTRGHCALSPRQEHPGGDTATLDQWEVRAGAWGHVPGEVQHPPSKHGVPRLGAPLLQALPPLLLQHPPSPPPQLPRHGGRVAPQLGERGQVSGGGDGPHTARPCSTAAPTAVSPASLSPGGDTGRGLHPCQHQESKAHQVTLALLPPRGGTLPAAILCRCTGLPSSGCSAAPPGAPTGSRDSRGVHNPHHSVSAGGTRPLPAPVPQFPQQHSPARPWQAAVLAAEPWLVPARCPGGSGVITITPTSSGKSRTPSPRPPQHTGPKPSGRSHPDPVPQPGRRDGVCQGGRLVPQQQPGQLRSPVAGGHRGGG